MYVPEAEVVEEEEAARDGEGRGGERGGERGRGRRWELRARIFDDDEMDDEDDEEEEEEG